ncbi:hypothetical protein ACFQZE_06425 [Paenibacillus sp. GCM10027627]|uniref:hypothetical protein n=1 Tax=unclassified Paenibacillus TaxID=185978 RepID=UPI00363609A6
MENKKFKAINKGQQWIQDGVVVSHISLVEVGGNPNHQGASINFNNVSNDYAKQFVVGSDYELNFVESVGAVE